MTAHEHEHDHGHEHGHDHGNAPDQDPPDGYELLIGPAPFNVHPGIVALLEEVGLPVPDHDDAPVQMMAALAGPHLAGCVGWESYGSRALLRSLAVAPGVQGQGVGKALTASLLEVLEGLEMTEVYLLTTGADRFFSRFGFRRITREDVPAEVLQSREFSLNCCESAVVMTRRLPADAEGRAPE